MAEQYLHGGQDGEARVGGSGWVRPGLSGPATEEDRTLDGGYPWICGRGPRRKMFHPRPRVDPIVWGWGHLDQLEPWRHTKQREATGQS